MTRVPMNQAVGGLRLVHDTGRRALVVAVECVVADATNGQPPLLAMPGSTNRMSRVAARSVTRNRREPPLHSGITVEH